MQNEDACREVIETLLHIKIKKLEYIELQHTIDMAYNAKGVRLDVYVADSDRVFDVEIQTSLNNELPLRSRYYQSLIDIDTLKSGALYTALKESYVIFICTEDPFKCSLPCYTFENMCQEKHDLSLDDKSYKVFYNISAYKKAGDIKTGALLEYLQNGKSSNRLTEKLSQLVYEAKNNQKWRLEYMTLEMIKTEKLHEGITLGIAQGEHKKALETARNMLSASIPVETIAQCTGLSISDVESLKQ